MTRRNRHGNVRNVRCPNCLGAGFIVVPIRDDMIVVAHAKFGCVMCSAGGWLYPKVEKVSKSK